MIIFVLLSTIYRQCLFTIKFELIYGSILSVSFVTLLNRCLNWHSSPLYGNISHNLYCLLCRGVLFAIDGSMENCCHINYYDTSNNCFRLNSNRSHRILLVYTRKSFHPLSFMTFLIFTKLNQFYLANGLIFKALM